MRLLDMLRMRARALFRMEAVDRELAAELEDHFEQLVQEQLARGLSPDEARRAARREFGPIPQIVERSRDERGVAWIANALSDLQYGVRLMRRAPGFALAAILTVALGMGATTAVFSVVYGVLLQPLPFAEPDRLVHLWSHVPMRGLSHTYVGMANVYDWRRRNHVFVDIAALRPIANFNLIGQGEPERLQAARVSANLFPVLGVTSLLGRTFGEDEDEIGNERVALLSYGLWKRRFASDPGVVGRTINLSGVPHVVVGVLREDFAYPSRDFQLYVPLTFNPQELIDRMNYSYTAVARLKPGVTVEDARAEIGVISEQLTREYPQSNEGVGTLVEPMLSDTVSEVRKPLVLILGAVVAMLLIGCANLANLLMARALSRERELTVRAAFGAGRGRLIAQSIAELVPMIVLGGASGLLFAVWVVTALVPLLPSDVPRLENIAIQSPVLAASGATLAAIAGFVGVWPALEASRRGLSTSVSDLSRSVTSAPRRTRVRDMLVVAQIAATLWLVIAAAILLRSFTELKQVNPGFNPERVYTAHLAIPRSKYRSDREIAAFCRRLLDRLEALPDVTSVGMVNRLPLSGLSQSSPVEFEGVDPTIATVPSADLRTITPDYFRTLQVPILAGRVFAESDHPDAPLVGLIDEHVARTVFRGADPIGRRFRVAAGDEPWTTIVGVVGHIQPHRLDEPLRPAVYWNYWQRTQDRAALVLRTRSTSDVAAQSLAAVVKSLDPELPVYDARSFEAVVDRSIAQRWLQATLMASFAAIALVLASIGVYGVIAYAVGQRRREFGIRMALGASRQGIVLSVLGRSVLLFVCGGALGLLAAAATARVLEGLLFKVAGFDLPSVVTATLVLLSVALAAGGVPASRAARVDPSLTLRTE